MTARAPLATLIVILLFAGCGIGHRGQGDQAQTGEVLRTVTEVAIQSGEPVTTANLLIEGMSCAMMCANSIQKTLAKLPGVTSAEVDFKEGDAADHAIVVFDDKQVSDAELIEAVHKLHGGQYRVTAIDIKRQVKRQGGSGDLQATKAEDRGVNAYAPAAALLPGVINILTRILRP